MDQSFFAMGGYAVYVWPCFALTALIMAAFLITTLRDLRARERRLRALEAQRGGRRRRGRDIGSDAGAENQA